MNFYSGQLVVQTSQQATGAGYGFKFHTMPIFNLGQNNQLSCGRSMQLVVIVAIYSNIDLTYPAKK